MTPRTAALLAITAIAARAPHASADITGFNNLSGWQYNQADNETPADLPDPDTIHITSTGGSQARSIFYKTRQSTSQFTASFTYRGELGFNTDQGASFILQNDPRGFEALGGFGSGLGYSGIVNSIAITWNTLRNTIGFSTGGDVSGGIFIEDIDLSSDHDIEFSLTYDGTFLTQRLEDTVTGAEFIQNTFVGDISGYLGGDLAFVGFGASSVRSDQYISDFRFTVPAPGSLAAFSLAGVCAVRRRRR